MATLTEQRRTKTGQHNTLAGWVSDSVLRRGKITQSYVVGLLTVRLSYVGQDTYRVDLLLVGQGSLMSERAYRIADARAIFTDYVENLSRLSKRPGTLYS